jgi:hypothetical protein
MTEYKNGKIYKIVDSTNKMIYVGSTTLPLVIRMRVHVSKYLHRDKESNINNSKCSVNYIFDTYGIDKCSIQLIEEYPCNSKFELNKREGQIIRDIRNSIQSIVNKNIAGRTRGEWYIDNKDKKKQYYIDNKAKILKYSSDYYKANKANKILLATIQQTTQRAIEERTSIENILNLMDTSTD